jgi:phosphoribosylamine--glycine ligase
MRVVVVGTGGREHALAWTAAKSPLVSEVVCLGGNPGTAEEPKTRNLASAGEVAASAAQIASLRPDLVLIGPEQPLVEGLADRLRDAGVDVVGPDAAAAQLEGSKAFAKQVMVDAGVPTAHHVEVSDLDAALAALDEFPDGAPVVKADGLAAGKGVVVPADRAEAERAIRDMLVDRRFGGAGATLVLEERLVGVEASYMVLTDGQRFVPLTSSQDHKRLEEGDKGPNTGGMGAFAPTPYLDDALRARADREVIEPVLAALAARGLGFRGFLYAGLMLTAEGPKVLEFNVRAGDPETQAVLFGLDEDLVPVLRDVARGTLERTAPLAHSPSAVIVLASRGYPESASRGDVIAGLEAAARVPDTKVFHAGTARDPEGRVVTAGGRVLGVAARGDSLRRALSRGYKAAECIRFDGAQLRKDVGASLHRRG